MPPKKKKICSNNSNIKDYFKKTDPGSSSLTTMEKHPGGAAGPRPGEAKHPRPGEATGSRPVTRSPLSVKKENLGDSTNGHSHNFTVKFRPTGREEYTVTCDQPGTVLEAIQSSKTYEEQMFTDKHIVIQLGKEDMKYTVATHFPCSCISEGESLFISCESEKVEVAQDENSKTVHSRDEYSVFFIDTTGGVNTRKKKLFISKAVKQFKYLCVYGVKGMTVEEALKRDGRFIDNLSNFTLSHNDKQGLVTKCTETVNSLDGKELKIRLPLNKRSSQNLRENPGASDNSLQSRERDTGIQQNALVSTSKTDVGMTVLDVLKQRGTSVRTALAIKDKNVNIEEIYEELREQFPRLKEQMERRFPDDSYQKAVELRKEDFGKIQQSFSEVHRVRKLIKLGESVCKVVVGNVTGTGFVLFDNYILTNAHILEDFVEEGKLKEGIEVYALFNYEDPEPPTKYFYWPVHRTLINYTKGDLDYAILEINLEGQIFNPTPTKQIKVPPGLLKIFGPIPPKGEACVIGHPAGDLKKMDPTCIIEKEQREQAVRDHLQPYKDSLFNLYSINHLIKEQGIDNIMMRGDKIATYKSFMYHGSSGSPVFDALCRVFGLHTAGFVHGFPNHRQSVIETAQPLLIIFQDFVSKLKESRNDDLLKRVKEKAKGNSYLMKILKETSTDNPTDEPMITE